MIFLLYKLQNQSEILVLVSLHICLQRDIPCLQMDTTSPHCCGQGLEKNYPPDEVWHKDEVNWLIWESICDKIYQETRAANEPVNASCCKFSRKRQNYKQQMCQQWEDSDMDLNVATLVDLIYIEDVLNSPLFKFITFSSNNCGYTGETHDLMVNGYILCF